MSRQPVRRRGQKRSDALMAYALLTPVVVLLGIFVIWPAIYALYLSFFNWSFYSESEFVGAKNYTDVLQDPLFANSVGTGLMFVAMVVPTIIVIAFLFASLVVSVGRRFATVLKVTIYIPTIISAVIASIVFTIIYDFSGGLLNAVTRVFGMPDRAWLGEPNLALKAIAVPAVWIGLGIACLIMVAGMLDIPESIYEAAALDGANWWQRTIYITIPQMKNVLLYLIVTGFVAAIQQYELPLIMTNGGPVDSTMLPNLFIFNHFRDDPYVGYSIASALLLFVVLGSISAIVFRLVNSEKVAD